MGSAVKERRFGIQSCGCFLGRRPLEPASRLSKCIGSGGRKRRGIVASHTEAVSIENSQQAARALGQLEDMARQGVGFIFHRQLGLHDMFSFVVWMLVVGEQGLPVKVDGGLSEESESAPGLTKHPVAKVRQQLRGDWRLS